MLGLSFGMSVVFVCIENLKVKNVSFAIYSRLRDYYIIHVSHVKRATGKKNFFLFKNIFVSVVFQEYSLIILE